MLSQEFASDPYHAIEFPPTSWPNLFHDLLAGEFEVAFGGISQTEQREAFAFAKKKLIGVHLIQVRLTLTPYFSAGHYSKQNVAARVRS